MFVTNICIALWFSFTSAYENLALNKPAHEEYPYNPYGRLDTGASNAVDGLKSDLTGLGGQCSMSADNKRTSTWWVNMTSIRSIHDIRIYYRTANVPWDALNGFTSRFLGFSIYVSNTTNKSEGTLCYKDRNFTRSTIPAVFNTTCFEHGQYVIYYNERLPEVTYPSDYSNYAFNDLCEVEVYGCPTTGYYGMNCSIPCPDVNCRYCHIETGTCQGGCKLGYKGHQCELECDNRKYGDGCQRNCGNCFNRAQCDHVIGACLQGCEAGYKGQMCDQECGVGFYGRGCTSRCGKCSDQTDCSRINGTCLKGCLPGYSGDTCKEQCQNRTYGYICQRRCGHCLNRAQCDHVSGTCLQGCEPGFGGRTCNLVNLALRKPASEDNIYIHANFNAGNAVDGRKSNLHGYGGECSTSQNYRRTATWWVNLESIYSIHDIRIYYRTDNVAWDSSNGYTARFLGFSIHVSNTTDKSEGTLCFKDRNFTSSTIPAVFETTCFVHGQYAIYYNERLPGVTYPSSYSMYAYNDLCEVEVYGCPRPGYYSIDCNLPCPDANCRYCHIETGTCQGCKPGYRGHLCELECDNRWYGDGCQAKCGQCLNMTQCDHVNGTCLQGCAAGYRGDKCDQECDGGLFGVNCSIMCGHCLNKQQCHHINGTCVNGCDPGYIGNTCTEACRAGTFGMNCNETCSINCRYPKRCSSETGNCIGGCVKGWKGAHCSKECDGHTYGNNCQEDCGICRNREECDIVTGVCSNGCDTGYTGDNCKETCSNKTYGLLCSLTCGNCINKQQCHHVTGKCPEGCAVGFQGEKCDKVQCPLPSTGSADHRSITYSVSALLALCVIVIILLTFRLCKHERCYQCHQEKQPKDDKPVDTAPPTTGHDVNVEDVTAYQELNEVAYQPKIDDRGHTSVNPDIYVNVEGDNSTYQALGEITQPSLYDTPFQN